MGGAFPFVEAHPKPAIDGTLVSVPEETAVIR